MEYEKPTVSSLDRRIGGVEQQLDGLAESLGLVRQSIQELNEGTRAQSEQLWTALGSVGGLDGIAGGLAELAEVLSPLGRFAPPSTAVALRPGVPEALGAIRAALGTREPDGRALNFDSIETRWDKPVRFIGEPVPQNTYERKAG